MKSAYKIKFTIPKLGYDILLTHSNIAVSCEIKSNNQLISVGKESIGGKENWMWKKEKKFTKIYMNIYISADANSQQQMDWGLLGQQAWCSLGSPGQVVPIVFAFSVIPPPVAT